MRIDAIELYHLAIPCIGDIRPYWSIVSRTEHLPPPPERWETVLVRVRSGDHEGWGEASAGSLPTDTSEWAAGAFLLLREVLAPALIGQEVADPEQAAKLLPSMHGNSLAKAAIDQAVWDLLARMQEASLGKLLEGFHHPIKLRATVRVGNSIDDVMAAVAAAVAAGNGEVNVKMLPQQYEVLRAIRDVFGNLALSVDCEGCGRLDQQTDFCRLDDFFLKSLEQPLGVDDLVGHAMLQQQVRTPICLDQTITSSERLADAVELASCRQVRIEPGRLGGPSAAQRVVREALESNIACGLAIRPQTAIGQRGTLALATCFPQRPEPRSLAADFFPADQFFERDAAEPLPTHRDADGQLCIQLPHDAGIGVTPDPVWLKQYTVSESRISK